MPVQKPEPMTARAAQLAAESALGSARQLLEHIGPAEGPEQAMAEVAAWTALGAAYANLANARATDYLTNYPVRVVTEAG